MGLSDTEVQQVGEVARGDDDVLRLDVAMDQPASMCGIQCRRDLLDDGYGPARLERTGADEVVQGVATDQAHVDVEVAVDLAPIVDRHDVGLLQSCRRPRLTEEPGAELLVVGKLRAQDLQRDGPALVGVDSLVYLAHAATAEQRGQLILAETATHARVVLDHPVCLLDWRTGERSAGCRQAYSGLRVPYRELARSRCGYRS